MSEPSIIETSPVDGRELGTYAEATAGEVQDAVARGRRAFQAWRKRPVSAREMANRDLEQEIQRIYEEKRQAYGSPRIHRELLALGKRCSRKR